MDWRVRLVTHGMTTTTTTRFLSPRADVTAFLRGIAKLSIQESHTVVHRNLVVQGGTVSVGNSSWSALDVRSTSNGSGGGPVESLLALNGDNDFVGGVSLGGHHLLHISGDGVLSGSMRFGANTSSVSVVVGPVSAAGTLRSSGGVRASRGLPPSVPSSTDLTDAGFAFDATLASSGMFLNDIGVCVFVYVCICIYAHACTHMCLHMNVNVCV